MQWKKQRSQKLHLSPRSPKSPKKADKKAEKKSGNFLAEHKAELRKVTWPNRQELAKETVTVIVVSLLVGVIIFGMDTALSFCYDKLMNIGGANSTASETSNEINPADLISVGGDEENSPVNVEVEDQDSEGAAEEGAENAEQPEANEGAENAEQSENNEAAENAEQSENNEAAENAEQSENNEAAENAEQSEDNEAAENSDNSENEGAENAEQ